MTTPPPHRKNYWRLAADPYDYAYSSAAFYEKDEKRYGFLKDLREEF